MIHAFWRTWKQVGEHLGFLPGRRQKNELLAAERFNALSAGLDSLNQAVQGLLEAQAAQARTIAALDLALAASAQQGVDHGTAVGNGLQAVVTGQADVTRAAVGNQHALTRAAVGQQHEITRSAVVSLQHQLLALKAQVESWGVDRWKFQELEGLLRHLRKKDYLAAIETGRLEVPRLETLAPVAVESIDTIHPRGCKNDNSICPRFNHKLNTLFGGRRLRVLDLGCAGGGLVRSLLDEGHFAVGLEGSDLPKTNQIGEWGTISHHLFTCDITKRFALTDAASGAPLRFDVITAWEVMEHIPEPGLPALLDNLERHLAPGGYLMFSIATFVDWDPQSGVVWHVTVQPREWWTERFRAAGFEIETEHPFGKWDWLRGSGHCRGDWDEDMGWGFHLVLRRAAEMSRRTTQAAA